MRKLFLMSMLTALSIGQASAAVVSNLPGGQPLPIPASNLFTTGPVSQPLYVWQSNSSNSVFGWTSGYGFCQNGSWSGTPMIGSNSGSPSIQMTLTFPAPVSGFLAEINWAPCAGAANMSAYDASGNVIESQTFSGALPSVPYRTGFSYPAGIIKSISFAGAFIGARNMQVVQASSRELSSISVSPANPTINVGQTQQFTATGTYSDGTTQTLTGSPWLPLAPMPTARSSLQGAAVNGLLYAVGGTNGGDTPVVEAYNPTSNTWSTVAPLNAPNYGGHTGRYAGSAVGVNGKVYMMGGWTSSPPLPSNTLSIYNPGTNTWSAGPTIPGSGYTGCSEAAVIGSKIYLLNACNGFSGYTRQLSIFDTNANSWVVGPSAPRNHNAGLGAALNGKFYVTGGTDGSYQPQVDVYNPATNTWTTVGSMPVNLWSMAGDVINGKWYIVGGTDPTTNYKNTLWIYDPVANTWTSGPAAPTARSSATAATINGKLYVAGGSNFTGNLSTLEVFDPNANGLAWSSDNTSVAAIDQAGLATGLSGGVTTITATSGSVSGGTTLTVVNPNKPPVANAGPDQTIEATGPSGASVTLNGLGSFDPDGDTLSYNWTGAFGSTSGVSPTLTLPLGTHTVTLTVSDGQATATDTVLITVHDTTPPALQLPANLQVEGVSAVGTAVSYFTSASDSVDPNPTVNCSPASGSTFALGTTPVNCSATDASGNSASGGFTVSVVDTTPPVLNIPAPITVYATVPADGTVFYSATAVDSVDPNPGMFCSPASGTTFPLGTTTVLCFANDASSNGSNASFTITIIDSAAPVLTVPGNISASATGPTGAEVSYAVSASDGFDAHPTVSCSPASDSTFVLGTTTVNCSATDASGNSAHASFTVSVVDTTPPSLTTPASINAEATSAAGAVVNYTATATDIVDPNPSVNCTPASGSTFTLGTTTVHCSASDASGNTSARSFTVAVADTTRPVLTVPPPITVYATVPADGAVSFSASAVDSVDPNPGVFCSPASGATFPLGTTTVFCSATDASGNSVMAAFTVHVIDSVAPVLTVPGNITASATGPSGAAVSYAVSALDGFDAHPTVSCSPASGSTFALGTTTVSCSASDASSNSASASFTISVVDTAPPVLTVPAPITVNATSPAGAVVNFSATVTDNVDANPSVSCSPASGSTFALGATTVNCTATDFSGNSASAGFTVRVIHTFNGFFQPVDNPPTLNMVKAGSAIPVKFSLSGNFGLSIFAAGYPRSQTVSCDVTTSVDAIEETVTAGGSTLTYDANADQYKYVWKTDKSWAGTCRQLVVQLNDGTFHWANFMLK